MRDLGDVFEDSVGTPHHAFDAFSLQNSRNEVAVFEPFSIDSRRDFEVIIAENTR